MTVMDLADQAGAAAIAMKTAAVSLQSLEELQRHQREVISDCIRQIYQSTLCARDQEVSCSLRKISERLARLQELSNMEELGAFVIQIDRAAKAVRNSLEP